MDCEILGIKINKLLNCSVWVKLILHTLLTTRYGVKHLDNEDQNRTHLPERCSEMNATYTPLERAMLILKNLDKMQGDAQVAAAQTSWPMRREG